MSIKLFVCGNTKAPVRKAGDAGIDLYMPNLSEKFITDLTEKNPGAPVYWGLIGAPDEANSKEGEVPKMTTLIYLAPGHDLLIPTYVKANISDDIYLRVANKSGVCTKQKLTVGAEVVDASYEGIMHIHVFNSSNEIKFINFGQKLAQLVPEKIDNSTVEVFFDETVSEFENIENNKISLETFYEGHESTRGEGGFGSTGLN